jgi:hypothetical protein
MYKIHITNYSASYYILLTSLRVDLLEPIVKIALTTKYISLLYLETISIQYF